MLAIKDGQVVASGPIGPTLTADVMSEVFSMPVELHRIDGRYSAGAQSPSASSASRMASSRSETTFKSG